MIQANELRIGIFVLYNEDNIYCKVLEIDTLGIRVDFMKNGEIEWVEYDCFSYIPLTHEILEKCGFEMHKTSQLWRKGNFYLHHYLISDNEYCFKYSDFKSSSIQSLHQLQNLYFALTGEELTYKF